MEITRPWLSPDDYQLNIGGIPVTFDYQKNVAAIEKRVIRGWLTDLIGIKKLDEVDASLEAMGSPAYVMPADIKSLFDLIVPFLCNAVWSQYMMRGNITHTDTGPVTRLANGTEPITDTQRATESRYYKGEADQYARKIKQLILTSVCGREGWGSGRPSLKAAGGKRRSRFD